VAEAEAAGVAEEVVAEEVVAEEVVEAAGPGPVAAECP